VLIIPLDFVKGSSLERVIEVDLTNSRQQDVKVALVNIYIHKWAMRKKALLHDTYK
jgi:hypothetical protein